MEQKQEKVIFVTHELIRSLSSSENFIILPGKILKRFGLRWPLKKGWVGKLVAARITITETELRNMEKFRDFRRARIKTRNQNKPPKAKKKVSEFSDEDFTVGS